MISRAFNKTKLCTPFQDSRADLFEVWHKDYKTLHDQTGAICFFDYPWDAKEIKVPSSQLILSYHNFLETPLDLAELLGKMQSAHPARFYKIATQAQSTLDSLRMLEFVREHPQVIGLCMGELGHITRILAPIVETPIMYASLGDDNPFGQLPLDTLLHTYHFRKLHRETPLYGVIGDPIAQSPGHIYHNKYMQGNGVYVKMRVKPSELDSFFSLVYPNNVKNRGGAKTGCLDTRALSFQGLSVTIPHKEAVVPFLDEVPAMRCVNTISLREGKLIGSNTDAPAALHLLGDVKGKKIFILGAGGSSRAIAFLALRAGAYITLFNRTQERAEKLAQELGCSWGNWSNIPADYEILINTTASGSSLPKLHFDKAKIILDLSLAAELILDKKEVGRFYFGQELYLKQAELQRLAWQFSRSYERLPHTLSN